MSHSIKLRIPGLPIFPNPLRFALVLALAAAPVVAAHMVSQSEAPASESEAELVPPPESVRVALLKGETEQALTLLDQSEAQAPEAADRWQFYRGVALQDAERWPEAKAAFQSLIAKHAGSPWIDKANFRLAEVCRELREFAQAEQIYRESLARLRSQGRQTELAAIYMDLAELISKPVEETNPGNQNPEYQVAIDMYLEVLKLEIDVPSKVRTYMGLGRCASALNDHAQAAKHYAAISELSLPSDDVQRWRAAQLVGVELFAQGDYSAARRSMEDLLRTSSEAAPEGERAKAVLAQTRAMAQRRIGDSWQAQGELPLALGAWRKALEDFPTQADNYVMMRSIAEALTNAGRTDEAVAAWQALAQAQPGQTIESPSLRQQWQQNRQRALYSQANTLALAKRYPQAISILREYIRRFPDGEDWPKSQKQVVDLERDLAYQHMSEGRWNEARNAMQAFVEEHPLDERVNTVQFDIGKSFELEAIAQEPIDRDLIQSAIKHWDQLAHWGSQGGDASAGLYNIARVMEKHLRDMPGAVRMYRSANVGFYAGHSATALRRLQKKELSLQTLRTARSNETCKVHVDVRNLTELTVQIYALDLEAYYRKHHISGKVDQLDLDLIAPDQEFVHTVAGYEAFAPLSFDLELPVNGSGVWAVAISSDAQRATTLVVQSDLDMIVKSSHEQLFVYTQNMLQQAPEAGVRLIAVLPNGSEQKIVELVTDDQGVARLDLADQDIQGDIQVLAVKDRSVAATNLSLKKLNTASSLVGQSLIYTERPAYRPGETLHWRAIARLAEGDRWVTPKDSQGTVHLIDPEGNLFWKAPAVWNEFGTTNGTVEIPELAVNGTWNMRYQGSQQVSTCEFQVESFRVPRAEVILEAGEQVVWRGDSVPVTATARTTYGAPLAGALLRWTLPDGRVQETRTDDEGQAVWTLETTDAVQEGTLLVQVNLPEQNLYASLPIFLATQGFSLRVAVTREVELLGSSFPVTIHTHAPDEDGVSRRIKLQALKRIGKPGGQWGEELLFEREVQTDEEGMVKVPIRIQEGGLVILRIQGMDRFGQTLEAQTSLTIAGEDDEVKLRLLTETSTLTPGETIELLAVNRAQPGLALLTLETNGVREHRLVQLTAGINPIPIQLDASFAPNVLVALSFMQGDQFYQASTPLQVLQDLVITMRDTDGKPSPGGQSRLEFEVRNTKGVPVRTELSLAIVDEALYQLFEDQTPDLQKHFRSVLRDFPTVRTQTSCTFAYQGKTKAIASGILAEEERKQQEMDWIASRGEVSAALNNPVMQTAGRSAVQLGSVLHLSAPPSVNDIVGIGGGSGGAYGGRMGGKKKMTGNGGIASDEGSRTTDSPTALWRADLTTDAEGKASVLVDWPQRSTRYRLTAHGVGKDNHFGSHSDVRTTQDPFFAELVGPDSIMEGDRPRIIARIFDGVNQAGEVQLELRVTGLAEAHVQKQTLTLGGGEIMEALFDALPGTLPGSDLRVELTVSGTRGGETLSASANMEIEVRKAGLVQFDHASGTLTDLATLELNMGGTGRYLELTLGHGIEAELVAIALGTRSLPYHCRWNRGPAELASDLMATCAVVQALETSLGHPRYVELLDRLRALVGTLESQQLSQGGWAWQGSRGPQDAQTTAHVSLALAFARDRGVEMDQQAWAKMEKALQQAARVAEADDLKAFLHYAMARMGRAEFASLNRLHRSREQLTSAGLAHLALALVAADRLVLAKEVLAELGKRAESQATVTGRFWEPKSPATFVTGRVELSAWVLLAMQACGVQGAEREACAAFLESEKPWLQRKAQGVAAWALAQQVTEFDSPHAKTTVLVSVDGQPSTEIVLDGNAKGASARSIRLELPDAGQNTAQAKARIQLQLKGGPAARYTALLGGFTPAIKTTEYPGFAVSLHLVLADHPRYQGKVLPTGFSKVRDVKHWENHRSQVRRGELVRLRIAATRSWRSNAQRKQGLDYLELEVPIPAGMQLLETEPQVSRGYRRVGSSLIFPIGGSGSSLSMDLELVGIFPGDYVAPPAILRSAYHPDRIYVHETSAMQVLPEDAPLEETYRPTPDELFARGQALHANGDLAGARESLLPLLDAYENRLRPQALASAARILLFAAIDKDDSAEIVRFFEIVKERDADLFVPLEQVLRIGSAYSQLGEHERAMLIFRAALEETFGTDLKLVGLLDSRDQWLAASRLLDKFTRVYPDMPVVQESNLALADRILKMAPRAASRDDLKQADLNRAKMTGMGIQRLRRFLAMYAKSPLAPDAALNLVSAFFELEDYETTAALCEEMGAHFKAPEYVDSFRYSEAVARWYLGQEQVAMEQLAMVAESRLTATSGAGGALQNRDLANYIIAQIYHANQEIARAKEYYSRVKEQFPDAKWSLKSLDAKALQFTEEVIRIQPGQVASLELEYRGMQTMELLAYPVDLMTLYLREKDLSRVTQVNLAGISPTLSKTITLGDESPLRAKKHTAQLELPEAGAYLVMARGGDQHASALILVSDLEVQVQDYANGQVRVQAFNAKTGKYLHDVDVRALGTSNGRIQVGKTDRRGLYVTDGVQGKATIIARLDRKHYAFHMGTKELREPRQTEGAPSTGQGGAEFYLQNVYGQNDAGIQERNKNLDREIQRTRKGVQVKQVK